MQTFKERYLPAVEKAGLNWGAYWWSDAVTTLEARREAQAFVKALDGLKPTYPVYMDQEYASPCGKMGGSSKARQLRTDMCRAFLDVLEDAGDLPGFVGRCDGVGTAVDLNDCYKDYPAIMKRAGLNGW